MRSRFHNWSEPAKLLVCELSYPRRVIGWLQLQVDCSRPPSFPSDPTNGGSVLLQVIVPIDAMSRELPQAAKPCLADRQKSPFRLTGSCPGPRHPWSSSLRVGCPADSAFQGCPSSQPPRIPLIKWSSAHPLLSSSDFELLARNLTPIALSNLRICHGSHTGDPDQGEKPSPG